MDVLSMRYVTHFIGERTRPRPSEAPPKQVLMLSAGQRIDQCSSRGIGHVGREDEEALVVNVSSISLVYFYVAHASKPCRIISYSLPRLSLGRTPRRI